MGNHETINNNMECDRRKHVDSLYLDELSCAICLLTSDSTPLILWQCCIFCGLQYWSNHGIFLQLNMLHSVNITWLRELTGTIFGLSHWEKEAGSIWHHLFHSPTRAFHIFTRLCNTCASSSFFTIEQELAAAAVLFSHVFFPEMSSDNQPWKPGSQKLRGGVSRWVGHCQCSQEAGAHDSELWAGC